MSVIDELREMEERFVARHRELQPLVEEYQEIERIATQLGFDLTAPAASSNRTSSSKPARRAAKRATNETQATAASAEARPKPAPKRRKRPAAKPATSRGRATAPRGTRSQPRGTRTIGEQRREQILELIRQRPGITVPDISSELGVAPPPLYRVVRKLMADNVITKDGKSLALA